MTRSSLYRELVPDAPPHRRTDRDDVDPLELRRRLAGQRLTVGAPDLQRPSLVSTYAGSIDTLLLVLPAYGVADAASKAGYRSLIGSMRSGTRFIVVHHASSAEEVSAWFRTAGHDPEHVTFASIPDYVSVTDWAEDAYVALRDLEDGSSHLVEPWAFPRAGDALIADSVEAFSDVRATQAPLIFQGGNCLIGDGFWFLGRDYFADTLDLLASPRPPVLVPPGVTPEELAHQLFRDYVDAGRTLRLIGTEKPIPIEPFYGTRSGDDFFLDVADGGTGTYQPIFHIDMFITLLGEGPDGRFRVLVGSPSVADQLLGRTSPYSLDAVYDRIAADLGAWGFEVHRNPLVHRPILGQTVPFRYLRERAEAPDGALLRSAVATLAASGATDDTAVTVRDWYHITWNNCLVERSEQFGHTVYMPTFGHSANADLAPIDDHMEQLFNGLGYTVQRLADFDSFARRQGVVHCIKKYLARGS